MLACICYSYIHLYALYKKCFNNIKYNTIFFSNEENLFYNNIALYTYIQTDRLDSTNNNIRMYKNIYSARKQVHTHATNCLKQQ